MEPRLLPADDVIERSPSSSDCSLARRRKSGVPDRHTGSSCPPRLGAHDRLHFADCRVREERHRAGTEPTTRTRPSERLHESATVEFGVSPADVVVQPDHDDPGGIGEMHAVRRTASQRSALLWRRDHKQSPRLAIPRGPTPPGLLEHVRHQIARRNLAGEASRRREPRARGTRGVVRIVVRAGHASEPFGQAADQRARTQCAPQSRPGEPYAADHGARSRSAPFEVWWVPRELSTAAWLHRRADRQRANPSNRRLDATKPLVDLSIYEGFLRWSRPASIR